MDGYLPKPVRAADLAAALAAGGADVVGARVATAGDGTALDVFELQDGSGAPYGQAEPRRLTRLVAELERAARGGGGAIPPEPQPNPRRAAFDVRPVVLIDLDESPDAAVIELSGADRPLASRRSRTASSSALNRSSPAPAAGRRPLVSVT